MSIMPKKANPNDLTPDEIEFLRGSQVPDEIKRSLARQHENIGTGTTAFRKLANYYQAKVDSILTLRDLQELQGESVTATRAKEEASVLKQQNAALEATVSRKDAEILKLRSIPAMAVHSGRSEG